MSSFTSISVEALARTVGTGHAPVLVTAPLPMTLDSFPVPHAVSLLALLYGVTISEENTSSASAAKVTVSVRARPRDYATRTSRLHISLAASKLGATPDNPSPAHSQSRSGTVMGARCG